MFARQMRLIINMHASHAAQIPTWPASLGPWVLSHHVSLHHAAGLWLCCVTGGDSHGSTVDLRGPFSPLPSTMLSVEAEVPLHPLPSSAVRHRSFPSATDS